MVPNILYNKKESVNYTQIAFVRKWTCIHTNPFTIAVFMSNIYVVKIIIDNDLVLAR